MRLAIFSKPFWPSIGGVEQSTRIMASLLSERGWCVTVVTGTALNGLEEISESFKVIRSVSFTALLRVCRSSDVLVVNGGISIPASLASVVSGTPMVAWHQMAGSLTKDGFSATIRNLLTKWCSARAAIHVGVSQACLKSKELPFSARSHVVFNPVSREISEFAKSRAGQRVKDIEILFVGRMIEGKGVLVLAEAIKQLKDLFNEISVAFVGDGPLRTRLQSELTNLHGLSVTFAGSVDAENIGDFYNRARCLVLPSTFHPEGMPLVVGEAQTFGLPVIASDQPANIESVGNAGVLVRSGEVDLLAGAIAQILQDEAQYLKYSGEALALSSRFSPGCFADQVEGVLEEAVEIKSIP